MKAGKVWGETHRVFGRNDIEVHLAHIDKGKHCSKHQHRHKVNLFYVVSGILRVKVWKNDYDLCDQTVLNPGQSCEVMPGEYHQFEGVQDATVLEVYYVELDPSDIDRESVGG